ncbi:hypothetical protein [Pseudomonas fragi]|uniref:hypothetical protein n=1 Tax=Pseudomonas fragi TaxID=296 RepID=UPI000BA21E6B|nr:hypothetical protein [Pseudomonas fragi]PAA13590.1 hypothetical protein CJU74_17425 [Pseudomonas fragi]
MLKILAMFIFGTIAGFLAYYYKAPFSYADFKDYGYTLLTISGMVFTIMGIWIAFIYPNAILRLQDPEKIKTADFSRTLQDTRRLETVVGAVMASGTVAIGVSAIYFLKLLMYGLPAFAGYHIELKSAAIGAITFLSLVQLSAVGYVIYSNYLFIEDLHVRREGREADGDF